MFLSMVIDKKCLHETKRHIPIKLIEILSCIDYYIINQSIHESNLILTILKGLNYVRKTI